MKTYRELSASGIASLSFVQPSDRFTKDGRTYEVGERIEDDTYVLTELSTGKKDRCFLNQVLAKTKTGVYNNFRRIVKDVNPNDIIYDIYRDRYYTILSFAVSNYNEDLITVKDHNGNKQITWRKYYILERLNKDRFRLISNTTNNNEKITVTNTDVNRERNTTAISSSTTRQIAGTSRLVGNGKTSAIKETRVGGFKISQNAISN